jgi:hypothetical protein
MVRKWLPATLAAARKQPSALNENGGRQKQATAKTEIASATLAKSALGNLAGGVKMKEESSILEGGNENLSEGAAILATHLSAG